MHLKLRIRTQSGPKINFIFKNSTSVQSSARSITAHLTGDYGTAFSLNAAERGFELGDQKLIKNFLLNTQNARRPMIGLQSGRLQSNLFDLAASTGFDLNRHQNKGGAQMERITQIENEPKIENESWSFGLLAEWTVGQTEAGARSQATVVRHCLAHKERRTLIQRLKAEINSTQ